MSAAVTRVLALLLTIAPGIASAQRTSTVLATTVPPPREASAPAPSSESRSIGVPDRGRLRNAVELVTTPHLLARTGRRPANYGTSELVGLLTRAAASVRADGTGPRMVVGDLSGQNGGRLSPHRSHRSGRDADVSFYLTDGEGHPVEPPHFVQIRRSGCGEVRGVQYCLDVERSWELLVALVSDPVARVQYVLVAPDLRRRLIEEGQRRNAPAALMDRVMLATEPHSGSHSHRSHFHVRIYCPVGDRPECVDEPPYHAWYEGEPAPRTPQIVERRARERRVARARRARVRARAAQRPQPRRQRRERGA
jgi:penicillin-insensitive murein endopeptidase